MRTITYWLSLVMIFVIPWENVINIEGVGTISRTVGLLLAMFWIISVVGTDRFRKPRAFHLVFIIFVLWHAASVFWSVDIDSTLNSLFRYVQLFVFVYILWDLYTTPAALKAGLQAYVLGAYVSIGNVIVNYQAGVAEDFHRFSATGFNANDVALILVLGMPVAWHLAVSEGSSSKTWLLRLINFAYVPVALFAVLLTSSRAASFATLIVFLFILASLTSLKPYLRVLVFVAVTGSLLALQPLVPERSFHRLATTGTEITEGDLNNRLGIWREGIVVFSEHPILGIGSGAFRAAATETRGVPHSFVVGLLTEVGSIGFGLFATLVTMTVYSVGFLPKSHSRLWLTILIIWVLGAATHNWEHRKQTWLFLSLAVANASLFVRRRETRPTTTFPLDSSELTRSSAPDVPPIHGHDGMPDHRERQHGFNPKRSY
ncbi:MAG: O-antigen ligase family protein [Acidiferrobacterales bacterium]